MGFFRNQTANNKQPIQPIVHSVRVESVTRRVRWQSNATEFTASEKGVEVGMTRGYSRSHTIVRSGERSLNFGL